METGQDSTYTDRIYRGLVLSPEIKYRRFLSVETQCFRLGSTKLRYTHIADDNTYQNQRKVERCVRGGYAWVCYSRLVDCGPERPALSSINGPIVHLTFVVIRHPVPHPSLVLL